ncbi:glycosyltransferase [Sphingomonas histidinilytica]|jgi:glycosyltransferase involved in cell wall biosynthesis|uniref:Glycosyltransferase involved in cell wall bisynthesis n=1 Tax=Rhizorhabdus histidinilytica TaxID=439228 RepID=A0A1T5GZ90_9SPHN|nr:glycosyltransferase family 1 protein [Rhizorhabdus histidinilytica]MBO9380123.1 glycosyltransferase [Rhizorhabdus histidinilytica]QEH79828.1 glycosyltransferase family 4 protein [Sphingomonas sp. C8-2]SKC13681.1 Glycosyltransferase involved in cell wall bisynthesis [Rhizorhabdus histidinilytica]
MPAQTPNVPVAIDARMLGRPGTGVATYAAALETALILSGRAPLRVTDPSCGRPMDRSPAPARWLRWADALVDRPRRLAKHREALAGRDVFRLAQVHFDRHGTLLRLRAPGAPGLVHWTYPLPIRIEGWINVYTVHDAIPIFHPSLSQIDAGRHRRLLDALARSADHLLTVSEAARRDIVAAIGCPPEAISACPPGLDIAAAPDPLPDGLVPGGFLLAVGSVEPRKNLLRLAEAHARSGLALPLVIAGPDGWQSGTIAPRLTAFPGIIRLPYVDRATLVALIAGARALLFPTITEGFGLPIVEAMQLGTPVLTSRGGATEEVAGGAALLADPLSVDEIAADIARLGDEATLARLRAAGLARGRAFTAAAFAERIDAVHRRLIERHGQKPGN